MYNQINNQVFNTRQFTYPCQFPVNAPFLKPRQNVYSTHKRQADGLFFEVLLFPLQYIGLLLATALLMMLQEFGMICLMMCAEPLLCILSGLFSLHKYTNPSLFFLSVFFLSMVSTSAISQHYDYCLLLLFGAS